MKLITVELECSHTATVEVAQVPAQPNHLHVICEVCHGHFAALRVTRVEELAGTVLVADDNNAVRVLMRDDYIDDPDLGAKLNNAVSGIEVTKIEGVSAVERADAAKAARDARFAAAAPAPEVLAEPAKQFEGETWNQKQKREKRERAEADAKLAGA